MSLTDKEIEAGWHQTFSTSNPYCPCNLKSFTKAVRWAESNIAAPAPVASPAAPAPASLFEDMLQSLEHVEAVYRLNVVKDNGEPSSTLQNLQRVIARAKGAAPAPIYQWREPGRPDTEGWMDCDLARYDEVAKKIAENPRRTHLECRIVYSGAAPADRQGVALSEQLQTAYDKVSVYPEDRMAPDAVLALGEGFMDLLALRNLVPAAIDAISRASSSRAEVGRMPLSEREAFEEWFRRNVNPNATMTRHPDDWPNNPGEYRSIITEDRWKTWLGRAEWVVEKPSVETLNRMAYILRLVPDGETVPGPMLLVLKDQYVAAMLAAAEAPNGEKRDA